MSTFLNVLDGTVIALLVALTIISLIRLTVGDAAPGKAKPGVRATAWRLLCYFVGLLLGSASHLVHGRASWVPVGLGLCLVVFAFIWDMRLLFRRPSRA
jgi:hypothetical protein